MDKESLVHRKKMLDERREKTGRKDLCLSKEKQCDFIVRKLDEDINNLEEILNSFGEGQEEKLHEALLKYLDERFDEYIYIPKAEKCYPYFSYRGYDFLINIVIYLEIQTGVFDYYKNRESDRKKQDFYFFKKGIWPQDNNFADTRFQDEIVIRKNEVWQDIEKISGYLYGYTELIEKIDRKIKGYEYSESMPVEIIGKDSVKEELKLDNVYRLYGFYLFFMILNTVTGEDKYGNIADVSFRPWQRDSYLYNWSVYCLHLLFGVPESMEERSKFGDEEIRDRCVHFFMDEYNVGYEKALYRNKNKDPYNYEKDNAPLRPEIYKNFNKKRIRYRNQSLYILPCLDDHPSENIHPLLQIFNIQHTFIKLDLETLLDPDFFEMNGINRPYTYEDEKTAYELICEAMDFILDFHEKQPDDLANSINKLFKDDMSDEIIRVFSETEELFRKKGFNDKGKRIIDLLKLYDNVDQSFRKIGKRNRSIRKHTGYLAKKMKNKYVSHDGAPEELTSILFTWTVFICNLLDVKFRQENRVKNWMKKCRDLIGKINGGSIPSEVDTDGEIDAIFRFFEQNFMVQNAQNESVIILDKKIYRNPTDYTQIIIDANGNRVLPGTRDELAILQDAEDFKKDYFTNWSKTEKERYYLYSFSVYLYRSMKNLNKPEDSVEKAVYDITKMIIMKPEKVFPWRQPDNT